MAAVATLITPELASWLRFHKCYDVQEVTVTIGNTEYAGCKYHQDAKPPVGAPNQSPYTIEAFYLLGELPASYQRSTRTAYTWSEDSREWYVASYCPREIYDKQDEEHRQRYSRFGPHFLLHPWQVPSGEAIDRHEESPYRRMSMTVVTKETAQ